MAERYVPRGAHPVVTAGGIMPGGPEMTNWYTHVPFPNPQVLAAKRAALLAQIEEQRGTQERATPGRPPFQVVGGGEAEGKQAA